VDGVYNSAGIMLANLRALFGVVFDIVLLRRGPEHLPASPVLLGIVIAANFVLASFLYAMMPNVPGNWPLQLLAESVVALLWFHVALGLVGKRERFVQTMTAMFAISTLFLPVLIPLISRLRPFLAATDNSVQPPVSIVLPAVVLGIWMLAAYVRIVRSAFEWRVFPSVAFILAQNFATAFLLGLLFAGPRPPA
jgi:hypothetical protein